MRVRLEDIPEEGLDVAFALGTATPADLGEVVAELLEPPSAELHLMRSGEFVLARGRARAKLRMECSLCLTSFDLDVNQDVDLVFQPAPEIDGDEIELASGELDVCFFEGDEVDLGQAVLDEIGLAVPMAPLCRPECGGLCPHCGKPRQGGVCNCQTKEPDPRWAELARLKDDNA